MEQYNLSPLLPHREKVFALLFPTQYTCLIQSANDPQDPYPTPCTLGIKVDQIPLFNVSSPLSWSTVLTASPTLINFISLSFCLMSGNSFPTCNRTKTEASFGRLPGKNTVKGKVCYGDLSLCLKNVSLAGGLLQAKNSEGLKASGKNLDLPPNCLKKNLDIRPVPKYSYL